MWNCHNNSFFLQADHEEKKKHRQQAYQKFLTRGGAKNPGSKDIPEGSPSKNYCNPIPKKEENNFTLSNLQSFHSLNKL